MTAHEFFRIKKAVQALDYSRVVVQVSEDDAGRLVVSAECDEHWHPVSVVAPNNDIDEAVGQLVVALEVQAKLFTTARTP